VKKISFNNREYPEHQSTGNAAQFAIPFAQHYCEGVGYDIGCMKKEWAFPGAIPIDITFPDPYHAQNLPIKEQVDYIFSSHCLEHLKEWVDVLNYWFDSLKIGGILFLYLPHYDQEYWRPWNNRSHLNIFTSQIIRDWMQHKGFIDIFWGDKDLNNSFMIVGEKGRE
jgi:predicted SAM-dependent methyltransferase